MDFEETEHCCKDCKKVVGKLVRQKKEWEKLIEEEYPFVRLKHN